MTPSAKPPADETTRDAWQTSRLQDLADLSSERYWEQDAEYRFTRLPAGAGPAGCAPLSPHPQRMP